jgi:hypothetical protein
MAREQLFCNRAYRITNIGLDGWVHQASVGQRGVHMTRAQGHVLASWHTGLTVFGPYKSEKVFHELYKPQSNFYEKSRFILLLHRNISRLVYNHNTRQYVSSIVVKRMRSKALS